MRTVSFFLHASLIFYILCAGTVAAQEYRRIDIERLLREHPLMKKFDPEVARFIKTPDERKDVSLIRTERTEIEKRLAQAEAAKSAIVKSNLLSRPGSKELEEAWSRIRKMDSEIAGLKSTLERLSKFLEAGGIPTLKVLMDDVRWMLSDILSRQPHGETTILLNVFPRFSAPCPAFPESGLSDFLHSKDVGMLRTYASYSCYTGILFPSCSEPILFRKGENER
mgnify:CR=1 FL=1